MDIAWNPPGLSSAIDRLMDFWDENVGAPIRRTHAALPPQPEPPAETPASEVGQEQGRHGQRDSSGQGRFSALAALAGG